MRIFKLLLPLACLALSTDPVSADYKIYMQATGLFGVADDPTHTGWLEIQAANHGISTPFQTGDTLFPTGEPEFQDFSVAKPTDINSPALLLRTANGNSVSSVTVECVTTGATPRIFQKIVFTNVLMRSLRIDGQSTSADGKPLEQIRFSFDKIQWIYRIYHADGTLNRELKTGWDLLTNTPF